MSDDHEMIRNIFICSGFSLIFGFVLVKYLRV